VTHYYRRVRAAARGYSVGKNAWVLGNSAVRAVVAGVCVRARGKRDPLPEEHRKKVFLGERAIVYLNAFCRRAPHPVGSFTTEHDRVAGLSSCRSLRRSASQPEVQESNWRHGRYEVPAQWKTLWAVKDRGGASDAVELWPHYDSYCRPGAGDDGGRSGWHVETLRALRTGASVRNDMLFVITDGEEGRLLGASALVAGKSPRQGCASRGQHRTRGNAGGIATVETSGATGAGANFRASGAACSGSSTHYETLPTHCPMHTDMRSSKGWRSGT